MKQRHFLKQSSGTVARTGIIKVFILAFLIFAGSLTELHAQCGITGWARSLPNSSYTWEWDGNLNHVDLLPLPGKTAAQAITDAVQAAINGWQGAVNAEGARINITRSTSGYSNADIKVYFADYGDNTNCGDSGPFDIRLNYNVKWREDETEIESRLDLYTTVVHEMGHIFGATHNSTSDGVMIPRCDAQAFRNLSSCEQQTILNLYNPNYNVTVKNGFGGGNVKVDGATYSNIPANGQVFTWRAGTFPHTLEAIDGQSFGGYVQRYRDWTPPSGQPDATNPQSVPVPSSSSVTYTANFLKEFNVQFQNSFVGVGNSGVIKVDGNQYNSPTSSFPVRQGNTITAEALYQVISSIEYSVDHWSDGGTSAQRTFTPTDHVTSPPYTAYFTGKPTHVTITSSSGLPGTNVRIVWQEHPNTNVTQYQVWRKYKHLGVWYGPDLLTTLSRGTTSFTDYDFYFTNGYTNDLLNYDIRAYYTTEGTYADPFWVTAYGQFYRVVGEDNVASSPPTTYTIANSPNPFNPATKIHFQVVENANVSLTIYDISGRRMIELINHEIEVGRYWFEWNGQDVSGNPLASGIYFARLVAKSLQSGETHMLTQRMLLMK